MPGQKSTTPSATGRLPKIKAPFGARNRQRLIGEFLEGPNGPPWLDIYKLLLWTDKSTGLAHCYESDKCQPGKPWHQRALRFHEWMSGQLDVTPREVAASIDWLFTATAKDYAEYMVQQYQVLMRKASVQRQPFQGRDFPEPGEDPAIVEIIRGVLGSRLVVEPSLDEWREITQRIRDLVGVENKRKNLVGEGFEDVIAAVVKDFDQPGSTVDVRARCLLPTVPGFANIRQGDKPNKVDAAIINNKTGRRTIVTAKWSIRADREKQFQAEFGAYVTAKSDLEPFDYVLITNEFDPARLVRACEISAGNTAMFSAVVHISPQALAAVYGQTPERTMSKVLEYVERRRIIGVDQWLQKLITT